MSITQRIDEITKVDADRYQPVLPSPRSVKIELSPRCNLRCKFCSLRTREEQPKKGDDMDLDLFMSITNDMVNNGVEEIGLFYLGESFVNFPLLLNALHHCKQIGVPYVFLTSNGTLATRDKVEMLFIEGLDSLKWSVNSADPDQYHDVTQAKGKLFWRQMNNIREAWLVRQRGGYGTKLYASSIRYDGEQYDKMRYTIDRYVKPYVDEHYWLPLYGMALTAERMKEDTGWVPAMGNTGRYDEATGTGNRYTQPVCWSAFTEGHVRADGHMSACCFGSTDKFDVGDLTKQTFMEAWNSTEYQAIRKAQLDYAGGDTDALKGTMCEVCIVAS